jgi:hypothetical protein
LPVSADVAAFHMPQRHHASTSRVDLHMEQKVLDESKILETALNNGTKTRISPSDNTAAQRPKFSANMSETPAIRSPYKSKLSVLAQIITADSAALLRFLLTPLHYRESSANALYNYPALTSVQAFLVPLHVRLVPSTRSRPHRHRLDPPAESSTFFLLSPSPFFASRVSSHEPLDFPDFPRTRNPHAPCVEEKKKWRYMRNPTRRNLYRHLAM